MVEIGRAMAEYGHTLRTGGADGADRAFMNGCLLHDPPACRYELYLPHAVREPQVPPRLTEPLPGAYVIAAKYHPTWDRLSTYAQRLLARNAHVVLGAALGKPVDAVVTWTPSGSLTGRHGNGSSLPGGTNHTLRIVAGEAPRAYVVNLGSAEPLDWMELL